MGINSFVATKACPAGANRRGKRAWYLNPGRLLKLKFLIMKKLQNLGRSLSKEEQKKVIGGVGEGCTLTYTGCNYTNGYLTCDYREVCPNQTKDLCGYTCLPGDGTACLP
jgi:hypothetical protein